MNILVTGAAGFIGYHTVNRLVREGHNVVGIDNINSYYDVELKYDRLHQCGIPKIGMGYGKYIRSHKYPNYRFVRMDIIDQESLMRMFAKNSFDRICHLAAQAGVRYSLENPLTYIHSNIEGFLNILDTCSLYHTPHLVYASSSSVYGTNETMPFGEGDRVDAPASLYAVTKRCNELMAKTYSNLYKLTSTGLRFFTVYGPWGRPDMAPYKFLKAALEDHPIDLYNDGNMMRDFTYIDDIVEGISAVINSTPEHQGDTRIYNIGHGSPIHLNEFIAEIERVSGHNIRKMLRPMQRGDVPATYADTSRLSRDFGYQPRYNIRDGIQNFYDWYVNYNNIHTSKHEIKMEMA